MPLTTCGVEVVPSVSGTSHCSSWSEPKLLTEEVAMVGAGMSNASVAAGKLAADDVATVSPGIAKPAVLVAAVPKYGMESGIAGSFSGALVLTVIWGTAKVEVALGNSVPEVVPAVGISPSLPATFHAKPVSPSVVPATGSGVATVGMVKNVSVAGIRVRSGTGDNATAGVQWTS